MAQNILFQFLVWYFWDMPKEILLAWRNYLAFNLEFFSVGLLLKTWFAPWHQYKWDYGRGFDLGRFLEVFFSNMITRVLGAFMRSVLIIVGLVAEVFIFLIGLIIVAGWFVLPVLLFLGFGFGLRLL